MYNVGRSKYGKSVGLLRRKHGADGGAQHALTRPLRKGGDGRLHQRSNVAGYIVRTLVRSCLWRCLQGLIQHQAIFLSRTDWAEYQLYWPEIYNWALFYLNQVCITEYSHIKYCLWKYDGYVKTTGNNNLLVLWLLSYLNSIYNTGWLCMLKAAMLA